MQVVQGQEPLKFKANFFDWDDTYVANAFEEYTKGHGAALQEEVKQSAEETKQMMEQLEKTGSEFLDPATNKFTYEQLFKKFPPGVQPDRKQDYLTDEEFEKVFAMNREEFGKLKGWRQADKKKEKGLF